MTQLRFADRTARTIAHRQEEIDDGLSPYIRLHVRASISSTAKPLTRHHSKPAGLQKLRATHHPIALNQAVGAKVSISRWRTSEARVLYPFPLR